MDTETLRALIRALPPLEAAAASPKSWLANRAELRRKILEDDPTQFLNWSVIQATMWVGNAPWIGNEYDYIRRMGVEDSIVARLSFGGGGVAHADTNLIHQAYHLKQWEHRTGRRVENTKRVIEIGGGYGAMCLICRRLGFEGQYWIEDYPEFSLLQAYYLDNVLGSNDVGFYLPYRPTCDLLIACHSLSEMPAEERGQYLEVIQSNGYLFAFHCEHEGVDNLAYFTEFMRERPEYKWQQWTPEHLPNARYQVGIKYGT